MNEPTTTTHPALLLRIPEVCELLAVGRSTLYLLMARGELDAVHIGRSVRITTESAVAYVELRKSTGRFLPNR